MQVLIKSDGLPTYHFANVVDDYLMNITHVIRGEEWINSTPKHVLLYEYFGWEPPIFFHMPLLRNPDKSKLSKRKNPTSIHYYRDAGYQSQAVLNYLGMMGWSMPDSREKFSFEEMVSEFDLQRVSLGGPVFDIEKLDWLNGRYLREDLSDHEFWMQFKNWGFGQERIEKIVPLLRDRVEKFSDVIPLVGFLFGDPPSISRENFNHSVLSADDCLDILQLSIWELEKIQDWQREFVESSLMSLAKKLNLKPKEFLFPLFVSITGKAVSTSVIEAAAILGLDLCRARVRESIAVLGGLSKKNEKALAKKYKAMVNEGV
jgi:glutamyl-tRNA synthetase